MDAPPDIGANLLDPMYTGTYNDKQYHDADLGQVLVRAWEAGLQRIIITAGSLAEAREALALARTDGALLMWAGGAGQGRRGRGSGSGGGAMQCSRMVSGIPAACAPLHACGLDCACGRLGHEEQRVPPTPACYLVVMTRPAPPPHLPAPTVTPASCHHTLLRTCIATRSTALLHGRVPPHALRRV